MARERQLKQQREQEVIMFAKMIDLPEFKQEILEIALLHPSCIYELNLDSRSKNLLEKSYRRLAHLGDAVLGAMVTEYLYEQCPDCTVGELTEAKKHLVDKALLFEFAKELELPQFCRLGKSQQGKPLNRQEKLFAEMFQAVFGAIYLGFDRDFSKARSWLIESFIAEAVDEIFNTKTGDKDEYFNNDFNTTISTREYLDMIGSEDLPDYGWAPGDDDD